MDKSKYVHHETTQWPQDSQVCSPWNNAMTTGFTSMFTMKQRNDHRIHTAQCRNKTEFSFPRQLTTWHCPHLLLSAGLLTTQQSIDISGRMGQTDGRTPDRCTDPAPHTTPTVPITAGSPASRFFFPHLQRDPRPTSAPSAVTLSKTNKAGN